MLPKMGLVLLVAVSAVVNSHLLLERREEEVVIQRKYHDVAGCDETLK